MFSKFSLRIIVASLTLVLSSCGYARFIKIPYVHQIRPMRSFMTTDKLYYQAGIARAIITPPHNTWLAGFMPWRSAQGIHDDLEVRVLTLIDTNGKAFSFVTADIIGFMRNDVEQLQKIVKIQNLEIIVFSSHTHAGPDMIGYWGALPFTSGRNEVYINEVIEQMARLIYESLKKLYPVIIKKGGIDAIGFSKNRRESFLDTELSTLAFSDANTGRLVSVIVNFGCHPEVLKEKNRLISSDFVGALRNELDTQLDTTTLFINGALGGMVQPNMQWKDNERPETSDAFGKELARLAKQALITDKKEIDVGPIIHRKEIIKIPLTNKRFWLAVALGFIPHRGAVFLQTITTEINVIKIGDTTIITVPGEIVPELGLKIKKIGGPGTQVWSLANDEIGYILVKDKFFTKTFKYERTMSVGPDAGPIIMRSIKKNLKQ